MDLSLSSSKYFPFPYFSVGYSFLLKKEKAIIVQSNGVTITKGLTFGFVLMMDFLEALTKKFKHNTTSFKNYQHIFVTQVFLER